MRRTTSRINKRKRQPHVRALRARVTSPRIRLHKSLRALKIVALLCVLGAGVYATQLGLRETWKNLFHQNPDYLLKEITLETNGSLDLEWVKQTAKIEPNNTVFSVKLDEIRAALEARPEVISADVQKRLPDILEICIVERIPAVWISCQNLSLVAKDADDGLLADAEGNLFRCEGAMWDHSQDLPIIDLKGAAPEDAQHLKPGGKLQTRSSLAALKLALLTSEEPISVTPRLVQISERNEFSLHVEFDDNSEAVFGLFDHQRQLADFRRIWQHATENGRLLANINLIPRRNIPVTFRSPAPRKAMVVEE